MLPSLTSLLFAGLLVILIPPACSESVYMQVGLDFGDCNMKCPNSAGVMELYRQCGGNMDPLLELHCDNLYTKNNYKARLQLDTQSGCWTMTQAVKSDSCVYTAEFNGQISFKFSTDIRVLDPILISNITSNGSQMDQDVALSVHYTGEESAVTWEVDEEPLPKGYQLIDNNRTLIISGVQRGETQRKFRVWIVNPVSKETRDYTLHGMLQSKAGPSTSLRRHWKAIGGAVAVIVIVIIFIIVLFQAAP